VLAEDAFENEAVTRIQVAALHGSRSVRRVTVVNAGEWWKLNVGSWNLNGERPTSGMRGTVVLWFVLAMLRSVFATEPELPELPETCLQAIAVCADSWNTSDATLQRFERPSGDNWIAVGEGWAVRLGGNGLAWGRGLHAVPAGGTGKREGDQKSPVGIFQLGPAFGYAPSPPDRTGLAWQVSTDRDFFVDDPASPDYNRWVRLEPGTPRRWRSAESMRRDDALYEFGIVVHHNMEPVVPGDGSAIFLHVWRGPASITSGCTAMAKDDLLKLITWLDPFKEPLLVQAPKLELARIKLR